MYDQKEVEELYDEYLSLDGNVFLDVDVDISNLDQDFNPTNDFDVNFIRNFPNLKNNNFISETESENLDETDINIQLDLLNQNFISPKGGEFYSNQKDPVHGLSTFRSNGDTSIRPASVSDKKDEIDIELKEIDEKHASPNTPLSKDTLHRLGWGTDNLGLWHSGPSSLNLEQQSSNLGAHQELSSSVSYNPYESHSLTSSSSSSKRTYSHQQLGAKVEMVYSLLSMLDTDNREDMSKTFLAMSSSPESCHAMRQSGCLPLLIQLIHSSELDKEVRNRAAEALHNIVHAQSDEKRRRREIRVLKLLQQIREYCDEIKIVPVQENSFVLDSEKHPITAMGTVMKFSFDAEHRQAICTLGGLHAIAELIQVDHEAHGSTNDDALCITLRRYAGMSLTNLTFGDGKNKALLCSFNKFMRALVDQLRSPSEDLRQVTASVLRNLSWRADSESKQTLRQVGAVTALTNSAMEGKKESTLKSILSALWNLSAHCSLNKIDICSVPGALGFLVKMLKYKSTSNTLSIVENAGGILRNISSHIAVREDYRQILRDHNCFEVLLEQLKSPSLTIVSNACGTLWNLSARCSEDQRRLWEMGATTMLRSLVQSKHKMISMGSSAALKNLLAANPNENLLTHLDSTAKSLGLQNLPTLFVRKQRALEQELNITLAETCDNIEPNGSPTHAKSEEKLSAPKRSDSRDSVMSSQSDSVYERINQMVLKNEEKLFENKSGALHESLDEKQSPRNIEDQKLMRRYKTSLIPTPKFKKASQEKAKEDCVVEDNLNNSSGEADVKKNPCLDAKEKTKKGIPVLRMKPRNKITSGFESPAQQSFSFSKPVPQHAEEDSVKYGKLDTLMLPESEDAELELVQEVNETLLKNSDVEEAKFKRQFVASDINSGRGLNSNSETRTKLSTGEPCPLEKDIPKELNPHVFQNKQMGDCEDFSSSKDTEKDFPQNEIISEDCKQESDLSLPPSHKPVNANNLQISANASPLIETEDVKTLNNQRKCDEHFAQEADLVEESKKSVTQINEDMSACNDHHKRDGSGRPNQSLMTCNTSDQSTPNLKTQKQQSTAPNVEPIINKTNQTTSNNLAAENELQQNIKQTNNLTDSLESNKKECHSEEICSKSSVPKSYCESTLTPKEEFDQPDVNVDSDCLKKSNNVIVPNFKIGSQMTHAKVLQCDANKICREIQKHQDLEMGCSLTSEVSLVSCSSFLDTGDCSLFEFSNDVIDLEESDNQNLGKPFSKVKNFPFRKPNAFQAPDSVSLPSLGSLKNEQIDAMDLDNSVISVASITSEIADTYVKDQDVFNTYTKTYKNDSATDCLEETLADGDATLNADLLQNNTELFDDDNSLHSQENLPLDSECVQDMPCDQPRRRMTPKEKRKTFHERYRTYTIRDVKGCNPSRVAEMVPEQEHQNANITKSEETTGDYRNQFYSNDDDHYYEDEINENQEEILERPGVDIFTRPKPYDISQFSKSLDKEHCYMPALMSDSKSLNDLLSIGPAERKELVDNAKLVAFSLKTAVHDFEIDPVGDIDYEETERSAPIDTATYSKHSRFRFQGRSSTGDMGIVNNYEECEPHEDFDKKGPRILKPHDKIQDEPTEEALKGIRGRRKPLYSSPQKKPTAVSSTTSSPHKIAQMTEAKKSSNIIKNHPPASLQREGTFTKEEGTNIKKTETKTGRSIPVLSRNPEPRASIPVKSAVGNKMAPVAGNTKRGPESSRITRPVSTYSSRNSRNEAEASHRRPASTGAGNRNAGSSGFIPKRHSSAGSATQNIKNSGINHNIRPSASTSNVSNLKPRSPASKSPISKSDVNLNAISSKDKGKKSTPKKEVTSKIASLWRKVEETKQKNKHVKDNRVWIGPEKGEAGGDEVLVIEQEEIVDIPTRKIVHSFTCQGLAEEVSSTHDRAEEGAMVRNNYRDLPYKLSSDENKGKTERRNIVSAVVPPYNYNPPAPVQVQDYDNGFIFNESIFHRKGQEYPRVTRSPRLNHFPSTSIHDEGLVFSSSHNLSNVQGHK